MSLHVRDVSNIKVARALANRDTYRQIMQHVNDKIILAANRGLAATTYYIRPLQPERPVINTPHAASYVRSNLEKNGFRVDQVSAGGTIMLLIAWPLDRAALLRTLAETCVTGNEPKI